MRDKIQEVDFTLTNGNLCETNFVFSMNGGSVCQRLERWTCNPETLGSSRVLAARWIGHFRVALNLCFKARQIAKPLTWKLYFYSHTIKLIFITKVLHLASFWKWEFLELGNGLLVLGSPEFQPSAMPAKYPARLAPTSWDSQPFLACVMLTSPISFRELKQRRRPFFQLTSRDFWRF